MRDDFKVVLQKKFIMRLFSLLTVFFISVGFPQAVNAADKVTICYGSASSALLAIAKEQGFTKAEGLDIELIPYTSGKNAMQAMLDGKCSLSTTAQTPVVHHSFSRNDFLILTNLSVSDDFEKILVRSDRGINKPSDMRGHSIALPQFATQHYLLDTFLAANSMKLNDVKRVYLHHNEILKAFRSGEVDAIVHREPEVSIVMKEFAGKAKIMPASGLCVSAYMLVGRKDFVAKNPASITRLLRALVRAEDFAIKEPAKAKAIAARVYGGSSADMDMIWSLHNYRISLEQSLMFILENMARWEIEQTPASQKKPMPNYLDFIYFDGLKSVRPEAVKIIR
jgi:NitT/TauT family transport system substrate-binding protein